MGYRSTVAYTIRFDGGDFGDEKAKQSFFTFLAEAKANEETAGAFLDEDLKVDEKKMAIYFYAEGVKWYEDYPDVKCHEALIDLSKEWADDDDNPNPCIGGCSVRMGENVDDCQDDCWGIGDYDWCYMTRQIVCDWME